MATRNTKVGDAYCSLSPPRHIHQSADSSKELPKNGDPPKSSFLPIGSECVPIGRHNFNRRWFVTWALSWASSASEPRRHRPPNCPCASGPSAVAVGPIHRSIVEERRVQ